MRVLVVYAHPNPESFNGALYRSVCETLHEAGHEVQTCDLYDENFEPRLSRSERQRYQGKDNVEGLEDHIGKLKWAEALVFVYPTWWMGMPAILKGWLDRVWLPGVVVDIGPDGLKPLLTNIKKIMVVTTQGSSRWRMMVIGNPPRKMFFLSMKAVCRCRDIQWLAIYSMDSASEEERGKFLEKVQSRLRQF
ncbi:NAD(P)H-dependent oxidoreductase [Parendozoicomonas sp. Alg238-R29]|uniref:NAD(P)H-dependent oxidoreductase n=1 Tax=Parendozoicomonas sp. Alg238-R29 TaxID=2993446 RepID=UPI00248DC7E2|nr:NAD(P)H-dependent oxidoreductase [Parendozoicomonas sp. Alg238-R29]